MLMGVVVFFAVLLLLFGWLVGSLLLLVVGFCCCLWHAGVVSCACFVVEVVFFLAWQLEFV